MIGKGFLSALRRFGEAENFLVSAPPLKPLQEEKPSRRSPKSLGIVSADFNKRNNLLGGLISEKCRLKGSLIKQNRHTVLMELSDGNIVKRHITKHNVTS